MHEYTSQSLEYVEIINADNDTASYRKVLQPINIANTDNVTIAYNNIAKGLYESNTDYSLKNALEAINKAIEKSPDQRQLYFNKALILIKQNELKNILIDIEKAINFQSNSELKIVEFHNWNKIILEWLKKWNEAVDSAESNYLIARFIYETHLGTEGGYIINLSFREERKNNCLTDKEKAVMEYINIANEKSNGKYRVLTEREIINKSQENYNKNKSSRKIQSDSNIYIYNKNEIDRSIEIQIKIDNFCPGEDDDTTGPEWLGGVETEEEFWEHTC